MTKVLLFFVSLSLSTAFCYAQSTELTNIKASLPQLRDSFRYTDALNRMAMLLYEKNIDSTFFYTKEARELAERLHYEKGQTDALNNLGVFFDIKGDSHMALRYYAQANNGYKKLGDSANYVQTLMNMGMAYKEIGKDKRAVLQFESAMNIGGKLSRDSILALVIYDYMLDFPARFKRDSMTYYIGKATQIATLFRDQRTLLAIGQLVADDMIAQGRRNAGLALLDQTIAGTISKKLYYVSMDMVIDIADQLATTDSARAVGYYRRGLALSGKNGYLFYSQLIARKLFDFYTARHDSITAAGYSHQLVLLYDAQVKQDNASAVDYLDYALKDQQVTSLELRSRYQTALSLFEVIICLLAGAVIIFVRRNLKRTKRLNAEITIRNMQMEKTLGALEQAQTDNTRIMKIAAHDLRNPVSSIYSIASMMLEDPDRPENDRSLLELVKTSADHSLELVSDLLQVQFRDETLIKEPVDLQETLRYCVSLLAAKAESKGQHINLETCELKVPASREKLWRAISNLIANAIKFSPAGEVIAVKMTPETNHVLITVQDHGIGIPPEMQDKIFDVFTAAKRPGTAGEQAFGLGLAITKQIIDAHGGKIWFESNPGEGTTFFVELPL